MLFFCQQVDLGSIMVIRGITIRGDPNAQEWVTQFKLKYGLTSQATSYTYYQEPYNTVKVGTISVRKVFPRLFQCFITCHMI